MGFLTLSASISFDTIFKCKLITLCMHSLFKRFIFTSNYQCICVSIGLCRVQMSVGFPKVTGSCELSKMGVGTECGFLEDWQVLLTAKLPLQSQYVYSSIYILLF